MYFLVCKEFFVKFSNFVEKLGKIIYNFQMERNMKKRRINFWVILFFMTVLGYLFLCLFTSEFECADETWNFQNIYKMYKGGLLYLNNNVIVTPIFFVIGNVIFQMFGANFNIFRMYGIIIYFIKILLIFLLFRKFKMKQSFAITYLSCWVIVETSYISNGANYNQLGIVFCLLGILWYFLHYLKKGYHAIQGIILFLIFFTKQTIGIYYAFGIVLFELLETGFNKKFFQNQAIKLVTFLLGFTISLGMMYTQGNLFDFFDLCFGSILEFGSINRNFKWENWISIVVILFIIGFSIYVMKQKHISKEIKRNVQFLLCLAIGLSFNMFPIMNKYHVNMAMLFYYLVFVYIIDKLFIDEVFDEKSHELVAIGICFCMMFCLYARIGYLYVADYKELMYFNKNHPFYNAPITIENKEKIEEISNYIEVRQTEGRKVIVLSYEAAMYMVPLEINNGELDLPFVGNLGYHGVQKTINKISNMRNTEFLIFTDEEDCFCQESNEIRAYIMNHLQKNGEILNYSIYINK